MKKRVISTILVLVMLLAMLPVTGAAAEVTTYKIGIAIYAFNDNFMTIYRQELEAYFASLETDTVKYDVTISDCQNSAEMQTALIDEFIAQDMDAIILNLVQTGTANDLITKITAADIPLVLINREPLAWDNEGNQIPHPGIVDNPTVCYVGPEAKMAGYAQGEIVAELPNKGDMDGDGVVRYVMIQGDPENPDAQLRTEYSIKALTDAGISVEGLVCEGAYWSSETAAQITAAALESHGDEIDVIFCNNDSMALGAVEMVLASGLVVGEDILVLGIDALTNAVEMVENGNLTGTVKNDAAAQARQAADAAIAMLNGEAVEDFYRDGFTKINADYFKPKTEFTDVSGTEYYADPVQWAVDNGITTGTTDTTFSPYIETERCQIVTFLWRAAGCPEPETAVNPFADVKETDYFYKAVLWAVEEGITTGTGDDTFSPFAKCERGQVVTFLWRAAGSPAPAAAENPFADVNESHYFHNAVLWAVEKGITSGTAENSFSPFSITQRCQAVTFLYRAENQ